MSDSQAYEYRAFLLQIAEKLSQEDSKKIAYLEDLPSDMESKPPLTLLMQLEMRGRVSASKPDDLAKILKMIGRHDLAKKVKDFAKQQKKGRPTAQSELQRLDHATMRLNASLQVTLLQCEILMQQVVNLREEAERSEGYKRVEEVVGEAHAIAEHFYRKLQYASKFVLREQNSDSNPCSPDSQLSSLDFEAESQASVLTSAPATSSLLNQSPAGCSRLTHAVNSSELRAAVDNLKSQSASLPRPFRGTTQAQLTAASASGSGTTTKQPLLPPANQRHPHLPQVDNTPAPAPAPALARHGCSLPRSQGGSPGPLLLPSSAVTATAGDHTGRHLVQGWEEQPRSGITVQQLVTGRLKPTPPPKPKIKGDQKVKQTDKDKDKTDSPVPNNGLHATQKVDAQNTKPKDADPDYDYVQSSSYTGTGDSGFGDCREFLRVSVSDEYQLPSQLQGAQHPPRAAHIHAAGQKQQQQQRLQGGSLDASYSGVNRSAEPRYYKSLQRDAIQGKLSLKVINT